MFRNYLKIAWRSFFKQKLYTFINIIGMTIGMTCFILIALYIQYESSFDLQHEKVNQIYRIAQAQKGNNFRGTDKFALAPSTLIPALKQEVPEIEEGTTLTLEETMFFHNEQAFYERGLYADESLFDVFTYPIIEGVGKAALKDPDAIILTQYLAKKYFGNDSPIGKTIQFDNKRPLTVKGIIADIPDNQHFNFDFITTIKNYPSYDEDKKRWKWASNNYRAYVVLPKHYDHKQLNEKLKIFDERAKPFYRHFSFSPQYFLQPLKDIHLHSQLNMEAGRNGDIRYLYLAMAIAFVILLLALINYMNLAIARISQRIKEVGVRKILGAQKKQLVYQFMLESLILTILSFGLSILLTEMFLPAFGRMLELKLSFNLNTNRILLLGLMLIAIIMSICAGIYPALLSTAITPSEVLKGNWYKNKYKGAFFRNALVIGQFAVTIVLGISSVIIYQQLHYIQHEKLGFNREGIVYIPLRNQNIIDDGSTLRNELLKHPNITQMTITSDLPLNSSNQGIANNWEGNEEQKELAIYRNRIDYNYINLFEMELVEGRNFSPDFATDSIQSYLLNESAVKALGWESAVGKKFEGGQVVGVVKDFHFQPFNLSIEPMYMSFINKENTFYESNVVLKLQMDNVENTLSYIQSTFKKVFPQLPFSHHFMNESYNQLYTFEKRFGEAFNIFTVIALFIACMGLFGLVTLHVLQRTKEIGVRKVLGASIANILHLISIDFLKLISLSVLIAIPIAWWSMNYWLQDFAYRIDLRWEVFIAVGLMVIICAFFIISSQSLKAALANPVDSIKID